MCQQPAVSSKSCELHLSLLNTAYLLPTFFSDFFFKFFCLTGSQQRAVDFQCSAQNTSSVSACSVQQLIGKCLSGHFLLLMCAYPHLPGSVWKPFCSTGSVCLLTGIACLNTSSTASNREWHMSTHWAPRPRRSHQCITRGYVCMDGYVLL